MEAQEGKRAHPRPLRGTLSVTGLGSAPVLTSSGAGTQMYSSPVVLLTPGLSAKSEGRGFPFKTAGNKFMEEVIRGDEEGGKYLLNVALGPRSGLPQCFPENVFAGSTQISALTAQAICCLTKRS